MTEILKSFGHSIVSAFQSVRENVFLNGKIENAPFLEKAGNFLLIPSHYLFLGKTITQIKSSADGKQAFHLQQTFKYNDKITTLVKTIIAIIALGPSLLIGAAFKSLGFVCSSNTRKRQKEVKQFIHSTNDIAPKKEIYEAAGIRQLFSNEQALKFVSPAGLTIKKSTYDTLTEHQKAQVDALNAITTALQDKQIPHFVDCGTCLGEFRHDGFIEWDTDVDMGIPQVEHDNVKRLLKNTLDPKLYEVQDWSSSAYPKTFLRVYVKAAHSLIDIYHYTLEGGNDGNEAFYPKNHFDREITPAQKKVQYIFSYQNSWLPGKEWKKKEKICCKPIPYDTLFPLKKGEFNGVAVYVPNHIERWLQSKYGDNLAPKKNWDPVKNQYT